MLKSFDDGIYRSGRLLFIVHQPTSFLEERRERGEE
jgi:hypothetical protein